MRIKKIILVVDDEYDISSCLEIAFTLEGYQVHVAFNGSEALKILKNGKPYPDLILTDLMMPVLDGYGLVKALKADAEFRHIPIILTSTGRLDSDRLAPGSWEVFVPKPFDLEPLLVIVAQVINKHNGDQTAA